MSQTGFPKHSYRVSTVLCNPLFTIQPIPDEQSQAQCYIFISLCYLSPFQHSNTCFQSPVQSQSVLTVRVGVATQALLRLGVSWVGVASMEQDSNIVYKVYSNRTRSPLGLYQHNLTLYENSDRQSLVH